MEPKSLTPSHIVQDLSQVRLALMDCARQLRYAARNVPGSGSDSQRTAAHRANLPPLPQFLGSVGHIADTLLETAETYAGHAIPPLQDHWKAPVSFDGGLERIIRESADTKLIRHCSALYYAAAKRFILHAGATDVLIFEHRINDAFSSLRGAHNVLKGISEIQVEASPDEFSDDICRAYSRLTLSLIDRHPIRSARFDELPDVVAPWWLVSEPNVYVFLLLGITGCARIVQPAALPSDPDTLLRFAADLVGASESRIRAALRSKNPDDAMQREFSRIVSYL